MTVRGFLGSRHERIQPPFQHRPDNGRAQASQRRPPGNRPDPTTEYQYVGRLGEFKPGDLAVYIQPDSVVPERKEFSFIWEPNAYEGGVPEKKRRIKARKFRGEWSEGLLLPLSAVVSPSELFELSEGDDIAERLGVYHYNPPEELTGGENERGPSMRGVWPRSWKGWLFWLLRRIGIDVNGRTGGENAAGPHRPEYDVEAYKNFKDVFTPDEKVVVTEKIHGSNARYTFDEVGFLGGMKMFVGSRRLWKSPKSKCIWRKALADHLWIEEWCRAHPGYTLYGEVVPTQKGYNYGCNGSETRFFVFDILKPDRQWADFKEIETLASEEIAENWVPYIYHGPFDAATVKSFADGPSTVSQAKHRREGVVVRTIEERVVHHLGRAQLKLVSNEFLAEQAA